MDWKIKFSSPAEAIKAIKANDHVVFSHAAAIPRLVPGELAARKENYHNVLIYHMLSLGEGEYLQPGLQAHFRHVTNFAGANSRQALAEGWADFLPCFFKDVPGMLGGAFPVDVAVIQVSTPDDEGFCSFGVSCDYTKPAAEKASIVIAEMNENMPRVGGDNKIHVSGIDHVIPCAYPLPVLPPPRITGVEEEIGRHCASLVEDGSTLQLGIGAIPDAVLLFLKGKKDLGIHTEMFSDGVVGLVEAGVITGKRKTLHPGKLVATFVMGTRGLYDFVDRNPDVELYPVDYVNDPWIIARNDKMVSINSCIEVDLTGQVASESMGLKQFSGTGGQVDYARGAALSRGGKSIMAMPSTAVRGAKSRIVPFLAEGAAVTTSRNDVDHVVTEYGIARLKGKTLKQRAESLIRVAHPDFRESLQQEFNKRFKSSCNYSS
ncbi:MAG: 4-hydroxybutyrate CoA-transferase [Odoribacteraceae bacterium]|nr:4-hydroxybutyrate CoA-transferase [Odoribacteraceae bacterium]